MSPCPPPLIPARLADDDEIPRAALLIRKTAEANGWWVTPTYARGPLIGANGKVLRVVSSLALRMGRDRQRCVAIWLGNEAGRWTYEIGYAWLAGQRFFPTRLGAAQVRDYLKTERGLDERGTSDDIEH